MTSLSLPVARLIEQMNVAVFYQASAKQLFQEILRDNVGFCRAIIHNQTREYLGHVFISSEEGKHELGFYLIKSIGIKVC